MLGLGERTLSTQILQFYVNRTHLYDAAAMYFKRKIVWYLHAVVAVFTLFVPNLSAAVAISLIVSVDFLHVSVAHLSFVVPLPSATAAYLLSAAPLLFARPQRCYS